MKIVMGLTSHDQLGDTGCRTGFWLEEFAAPHFVLRDAGVELALASPKGTQPPVAPRSDLPENQAPATARFTKDEEAQRALAHSVRHADVSSSDFDAVFYVAGHGRVRGLAESLASTGLLEPSYNSGKPIALMYQSPGVLRHVAYEGAPLVRGKRVKTSPARRRRRCNSRRSVRFSSRTNSSGLVRNSRRYPAGSPSRLATGTWLQDRILPRRPPQQRRS